ncbi:hypothetical protein WJX84_010947 [Apatococcus fuscideae]|uniref:Nuclear pore complex protein Nup85 n=1 Tax=Apatococcus fuscideae TaxID=2026836 RepID=A0AAW1T827_9CHLO
MGGGWRNLPGDPGEAWLTICFVAAQNGLVHLLRSLLLDRMGSGNSDPEDSEPELSDAEVGICEGSDFSGATCEALFAGGDTAILSWLLCDYGQRDAMAYGPIIAEWIETAVRHSYLAPVQWLREQQGASLFWEWPGLYAKAGSFEASELLRSPAFSCPCTADDYAAAVSRGSEEDSRQLWRLGKRLEGEALKAALAAAAASALVEIQPKFLLMAPSESCFGTQP